MTTAPETGAPLASITVPETRRFPSAWCAWDCGFVAAIAAATNRATPPAIHAVFHRRYTIKLPQRDLSAKVPSCFRRSAGCIAVVTVLSPSRGTPTPGTRTSPTRGTCTRSPAEAPGGGRPSTASVVGSSYASGSDSRVSMAPSSSSIAAISRSSRDVSRLARCEGRFSLRGLGTAAAFSLRAGAGVGLRGAGAGRSRARSRMRRTLLHGRSAVRPRSPACGWRWPRSTRGRVKPGATYLERLRVRPRAPRGSRYRDGWWARQEPAGWRRRSRYERGSLRRSPPERADTGFSTSSPENKNIPSRSRARGPLRPSAVITSIMR